MTTNNRVRDAWPVRRQTYDYLPSLTALPLALGWYSPFILVRVGSELTCEADYLPSWIDTHLTNPV